MRFLGPFLGFIINPAFRHSYGIAEEADCNGKSQQGRLLLFSLPALNRQQKLLSIDCLRSVLTRNDKTDATLLLSKFYLLCITDTRLHAHHIEVVITLLKW